MLPFIWKRTKLKFVRFHLSTTNQCFSLWGVLRRRSSRIEHYGRKKKIQLYFQIPHSDFSLCLYVCVCIYVLNSRDGLKALISTQLFSTEFLLNITHLNNTKTYCGHTNDVETLGDAETVELNTFHTLLYNLDPNLKLSYMTLIFRSINLTMG